MKKLCYNFKSTFLFCPLTDCLGVDVDFYDTTNGNVPLISCASVCMQHYNPQN